MHKFRFLLALVLVILASVVGVATIRAHLDPVRLWVKGYDFTIGGCPHGTLTVLLNIEKLMHENQPDYDWYYFHYGLQTEPGVRRCSNSNWETSEHRVHSDLWVCTNNCPPQGDQEVVDYDPTTTNSAYEAGISASVYVQSDRVLGGQATVSYSYPVPYVKVIDDSSLTTHDSRGQAAWNHDFAENTDPGGSPSDSTYLAKPAFVVRTAQCDWADGRSWNWVEFAHPVWWWWEKYTYGQWPPNSHPGTGNNPGNLFFDARFCGDSPTAPILDPIGNKVATEGYQLSFTATGFDADIDPLFFSLGTAPAGASITSGGYFTWTPTDAQAPGSYQVQVILSDGHGQTDSETFIVTVNDTSTVIRIEAYPTTDTIYRSHGLSIDQPLPNPWWPPYQSGYEFMKTSSSFTYTREVELAPGSHYVQYAASGFLPNYAWHAKIYINGVLKAEGEVARDRPLQANFTI